MKDDHFFYSPTTKARCETNLNFKKSPRKYDMIESSKHHGEQLKNIENSAFKPNYSHFHYKSSYDEPQEKMRQTFSHKRQQDLLEKIRKEDENVSSNNLLRQTMNYKSKKNYNKYDFEVSTSKEIYLKPNDFSSSSRIDRPFSSKRLGQSRSESTLLLNQSKVQDFQKISEELSKNKKRLQELKKNYSKKDNPSFYHKSEKQCDYLNKVTNYDSPSYLQFSKSQQFDSMFKKKKESYLTPKVETYHEKRLKTSPNIQAPQQKQLKYEIKSNKNILGYPKTVLKTISKISSKKNIESLKRQANCKNSSSKISIQHFQIGKKLGQGKFGVVNFVRHNQTDSIFALKKIPKQMIKSHLMIDQISLQLRIQSCTNHQNIISLYGFFDDENYLYILLEYMNEGTLYNKLKKAVKLSENETAAIMKQITSAIDHLHDLGIAHRDLKPENVVMANDIYKLCDFGWAAVCNERRKTYCGTFDYVAPEILEGSDYDLTVDLWCLGVLAFELMTGKAPFYHISRKETMKKILNVEEQAIHYPDFISAEAKDFIENLVRKDPAERISASKALQHPFLKNAQEI